VKNPYHFSDKDSSVEYVAGPELRGTHTSAQGGGYQTPSTSTRVFDLLLGFNSAGIAVV
jgi:hypothetical protein